MMTKPLYNNRKITDLKDLLKQSADLFDKEAFSIKKDGKYFGISYKPLHKSLF